MKKETASAIVLTLLIGSVLFSGNTFFVKAQTDIHDLRVVLEAGQKSLGGYHLTFGNSLILNATVWNDGNVTEPTVTLVLLINGNVTVDSTVASLPSHASYNFSYYWYPSENVYNITAYAPTVPYETNTTNNVDWWLIKASNNTPPTVDFTFSPLLPLRGQNVTFDASASFDPDWGNITTYSWNINGTTEITNDPVYTYSNFTSYGNANVNLTLNDTEGENNSLSKPLRVCAKPSAYFANPGPAYIGYNLTFDASRSRDPDNDTGPPTHGIANYTWNFGDNSTPIVTYQNIFYHKFGTIGTYVVNLTVTDYDGFNAPYSRSVIVKSDIPTADFKITNPVAGPYYVDQNLTFVSNSTQDGAPISSYLWDWNDTTNDTSGNVTYHSFSQPNTYNVTLTVSDTNNKTSLPTVRMVTVVPRVWLTITNAIGGANVTANPGETFNVTIGIINVENLGYFALNLTYPNETSPLLAYVNDYAGEVDLSLDVHSHSDTQGWVYVDSNPIIGGKSDNFTLAIVEFRVTDPGKCALYLNTWKLTNSLGVDVIVNNTTQLGFYTGKPVANFTYSPHSPSVNGTVSFDATNSSCPDGGTITSYVWNFGDNTQNETGMTPTTTHNYASHGTFSVTLTVTDGKSLDTSSVVDNVTVVGGPNVVVTKIAPNSIQFNETGTNMYETAGDLPINVTVINYENVTTVTFNVTVYFNDTEMKTRLVADLLPGKNIPVEFKDFDISGVFGIYTIRVDLWSKNYTDTWTKPYASGDLVRVYLKGDINRDNWTDIYDAIILAGAYNSKPGDSNWKPNADLNCDGVVDVCDAIMLAGNFNKHVP